MPPIPHPEDPPYYPPIYARVFQVVSFPQVSPTKTLNTPLLSDNTCYMPRPSYREEVLLHIFVTWEVVGGGPSALRSGRLKKEITSRTLRAEG